MNVIEDRECGGAGEDQGVGMKEGWQIKTLGDVCVTVQDGAHESPKLQFDSPGNGRFLYITSKNIRNNYLDLENVTYVDEEFHNRIYPRCRPGVGDVLLTKDGANTGNVTLNTLDEPFSLLSSVCLIKTAPDFLLPSFLSYFIQSPDGLKSITGQMTGAAIKRIILRDIKLAKIPIPPLPEQQRIVALLDEAFAGLATAKANAERNLQNARAIFESHLQSVFSERGEGWVEKRLEEVCGLQNGFAFKSSTFKPYGVPILRISNIQDGRIDAANRIVFFEPSDYRENLDRYRIVEGDLLIAMSGATTGKLGFNTESKVYYLNQRVGKFEPTEKLNKRFLYLFLSTKVEENLRISAGTAQPNLSTEQIKGFVLPLPSVDEQERIVDALETLSKETQRLTRIYERKLAALEELKKSLLHQAFNGEL
jgi:type I restriction enzyme S subunit